MFDKGVGITQCSRALKDILKFSMNLERAILILERERSVREGTPNSYPESDFFTIKSAQSF